MLVGYCALWSLVASPWRVEELPLQCSAGFVPALLGVHVRGTSTFAARFWVSTFAARPRSRHVRDCPRPRFSDLPQSEDDRLLAEGEAGPSNVAVSVTGITGGMRFPPNGMAETRSDPIDPDRNQWL